MGAIPRLNSELTVSGVFAEVVRWQRSDDYRADAELPHRADIGEIRHLAGICRSRILGPAIVPALLLSLASAASLAMMAIDWSLPRDSRSFLQKRMADGGRFHLG